MVWSTVTILVMGETCPVVPVVEKFTLTKSLLSQYMYHVDKPFQAQVKSKFLSWHRYDTEVWAGGQLVSRSYTPLIRLGYGDSYWVYDCHGAPMYKFEDPWVPELFARVWNVLDVPAEKYVGKVSVKSMWTGGTKITIYDSQKSKSDGEPHVVAVMTGRTLVLSTWQWDVVVSDTDHPAANPSVLMTVAGRWSFKNADRSPGGFHYIFGVFAFLALVGAAVIGGWL